MNDVFPRKRVFAVPLKFVPFYQLFRYDQKWWYHLPQHETGGENAFCLEDFNLELTLPLNKVVAVDIDTLPKSLANQAKMIY